MTSELDEPPWNVASRYGGSSIKYGGPRHESCAAANPWTETSRSRNTIFSCVKKSSKLLEDYVPC